MTDIAGQEPGVHVVLELFVQGQSARSNAAVAVVQGVCEARFPGRYRLDVIDIQQHPERTRRAGIAVAPALVRLAPQPVLRTVGRLTEERVLRGLGLNAPPEPS